MKNRNEKRPRLKLIPSCPWVWIEADAVPDWDVVTFVPGKPIPVSNPAQVAPLWRRPKVRQLRYAR